MFKYITLLLSVFCLSLLLVPTSFAGVTHTKIVVPKVIRTLPPKKVVKRKKLSRNSIVHTKILDSNLIDPNKVSF